VAASVLQRVGTIRSMYPLTLLEGQGMGTAYEYYSKLRVITRVFARTKAPRGMLVLGLPEKHGFDLDFVLLAHHLSQTARGARPVSLVVCEDRPEVLGQFRHTLKQLPDPAMSQHIEPILVDSLTSCRAIDGRALAGRHFDWVTSTASVQRLPNEQFADYLECARQRADFGMLFIPNSGNRAHLTLSGLRGLDLDTTLGLCRETRVASPEPHSPPFVLAAGYCDIPPFPPGLQRSTEAKERAMHSPLETLAMWCLQGWCYGESWMPRMLQKRLAHLVYVALDLREDRA
jgi:hypothetical protein